MAALPPLVVRLADLRGGVVTRRSLRNLGFASATIQGWLERGQLVTSARGVYRIAGSGHARLQTARAVLDRAGRDARIGGGWGCALLGLDGFTWDGEADTVDHVIVPPARRVRGVGFLVVRTVVDTVDEAEIDGLPAVTTARLLIGAAATHRASRVRVAADHACRDGLVTRKEIKERAAAAGRLPGAAAMRRIIADGDLENESEAERSLFRVFRDGDPLPAEQVWVRWQQRWFRLDFAYLEARLAIEYDGGVHEDRREEDADRDLALAELQIQTARITKGAMRNRPEVRRRLLAVRQKRLHSGLPPIVPDPPPWFS